MHVAYYALHYGKEYLAWSIRSIQDAVDRIYIFYSDVPTYGYGSGAACPDSRGELEREAHRFATKPIVWVDGRWGSEGHHRQFALDHIRGDAGWDAQVLVVDSDEVWAEGAASRAIWHATRANSSYKWLAKFRNYWRSFNWMVHDGFEPIRVIDLRFANNQSSCDRLPDTEHVMHFGYAQSDAITQYKWTCHGHQAELRPGWMERYVNWAPGVGDLHPVVIGLWDATPTSDEDRNELAKVLFDHPYMGLDIIR